MWMFGVVCAVLTETREFSCHVRLTRCMLPCMVLAADVSGMGANTLSLLSQWYLVFWLCDGICCCVEHATLVASISAGSVRFHEACIPEDAF